MSKLKIDKLRGMTLLRPVPLLLLLLASLSSPQTFANLCNPTDILGKIVGRPQLLEGEIKKYTAWLDAKLEAGESLPTIGEVLEKGTERQQVRLRKWVNRYARKEPTRYQIEVAATELSLILHDTKFTVAELYRHGSQELAEKMVKTQFHEHFIQKQLKQIFQETGPLKEETLFNALMRMKQSKSAQWTFSGLGNAYAFSNATAWGQLLIIKLPKHQFAKISIADLKTLISTGGVNSPKFAEIAAKYQGAVVRQVIYNAVQDVSSKVEKYLLIRFALYKYDQYQKRKADLKAKDQS